MPDHRLRVGQTCHIGGLVKRMTPYCRRSVAILPFHGRLVCHINVSGEGGDGDVVNLLCYFKCVKFYEWVVLLPFYDERCYEEGCGKEEEGRRGQVGASLTGFKD